MFDIIGRILVTLILFFLMVIGPFAIGYAHAKEPALSGVIIFLSLLVVPIMVLSSLVLRIWGINPL